MLAERWTRFNHNADQKYQDSFDDLVRAKENIKWLVAKGDLITEEEGIQVSQPIAQKLSRNGNRAGVLKVVLSELSDLEGAERPPTQMNQNTDCELTEPLWPQRGKRKAGANMGNSHTPNRRFRLRPCKRAARDRNRPANQLNISAS